MRSFLSLWLLAAAGVIAFPQGRPSGLLIRGGTLIDGTGAPARLADVRTRGTALVEIGTSLQPAEGEQVIDARGLTVAPGFIDVHSHADRDMEEHPDAASQILQGITTSIVGQDGGSSLPISDFFSRVERIHPALNYAASVGHGTVRSAVMGADYKRAATGDEIHTMAALVDRAMRDGALGLSSGLEYDPGFYATADEVVALARVAAQYGGYYASHVRDEENGVLEAWKEAIDVGRRAGLRVEISHVKLASKPVWGKAADGLALVDQARREGVQVMADWYPYTYWQSSIYVLIPDRDFENRAKWEKGLAEIGGAANVLVTSYRPDPSYNGRTIAAIALAAGKDPADLIVDMIRQAGPNIGIIATAMIEPDLERLFVHPEVLICSDGGIIGRHPRGYSTFPRVLARYVREGKLVPLPDAVAKMTGRSAAQAGLGDRGVVAQGKAADLAIFDAETIADSGTPQNPSSAPLGVRYVVVNGEIVVRDGRVTEARPGLALRRAAAARPTP